MKKNPITSYLRESKEELEKVSWPTRKDTIRYSVATIVITLIVAVIIGALDLGFSTGLKGLLNISGGTSTTPNFEINQIIEDVEVEGGTIVTDTEEETAVDSEDSSDVSEENE